jgi:outer membrane immunogenic protein
MKIIVGRASALLVAWALCSSAAGAQERPTIFDWTGFYIGFNYGAGVSGTSMESPQGSGPNGVADRADSGGTVGAQAGFNWQYHPNWVAGVEGDFNWLDINRNLQDYNSIPAFGVKTDWFGTLRGRWGYASGPSLIYVTGGVAWVNLQNKADESGFAQPVFVSEKTATGGTVGWGIETMLGGGWSTKAEYLYIDAGHNDVIGTGGYVARFDNRFHVFRNGLNYRFGAPGTPLPAHNWGGAYAGFFAGVSATEIRARMSPSILGGNDLTDSGFTGGVQGGFNWHITPVFVAGIEADVGHLGIDRTRFDWEDGPFVLGAKADWYGNLRAGFGLRAGSALIYGTAGGAFVNLRSVYGENSESGVDFGWAYGGGIEVALGGNWTAKSEYLLIDVGSRSGSSPTVFIPDATITDRFHVFRIGLNHKFGG